MNEIAEPLILSIALSIYFIAKIALTAVILKGISSWELYWIPGIMSMIGMFSFLIIRPLFIDTKGSS